MQTTQYTLKEIAQKIGAEVIGDQDCKISSLASIEKAQAEQITFVVSSRYQLMSSCKYEKLLKNTKASAVLLTPKLACENPTNSLVMEDPYQGLIQLAALFQKNVQTHAGIHPTAIIGATTKLAADVSVGAYCVIGEGCDIGQGTCISSNTTIGDNVKVGRACHIASQVMLYSNIVLGDRVVIKSGAVIGSEGFSMIRGAQGWKKFPHLGSVIIGNDVEIGCNTTIDRGSLDDTVIENGVKLDNQIQIAHGVKIGANTVIAACVGIAGSTHIGKNCMIGGACGISDNLVITDNVIFTGMSQVVSSIDQPGVYSSGTGIMPQRNWRRNAVRFRNLEELAIKLRKMEKDNSG